MDQYIGKMLDNRYEILECVGTGGMATVYKARCHRLNRLVAVKILKPELANDADFRRRFQDESQAVAMLSHANIVSVYDVSHSDGLDYIVMELIDGMTLKQYMKKRGTPLNWREALHFITQIVRALGHAHSRGIVHRDIKPHNIMVLRDGSVKVTDFGIARLTSATQATLTQEALGSVHYISPEQAKGSHVDGRSDLYSAGVVLYEMLTGRLPFEGETPVFVAIQHINSIPLAPRELNPDIPPALEAITMKAMAPNPDQRYGSAEEMLADLKEFRKNPGVVITPPAEQKLDEIDEPTMVIPVGGLSSAEKDPQKQKTEEKADVRVYERKKSTQRKNIDPERRTDVKAVKEDRLTHRSGKEDADEYEDRPRRGVPPILFAVIAILIFVCGIAYFLYSFLIEGLLAKPEEYKVPDLRGYTVEELERASGLLGNFTFEVGRTVYNDEYAQGQVCDQVPAANEVVKEGNLTITVTISGGQDNMYMSDVTGQEARTVIYTLRNEMGLNVEEKYVFSETITEGYIISYSPNEGTMLKAGDTVTIWISQGPEVKTQEVPNFIDKNIEQVRQQLELLRLECGEVKEIHNDEYAAGCVIWQSIEPGEIVEEGTIISFQVSKGPETEPEPTPSDEIPLPSEDVGSSGSTQTITVNLSHYNGDVNLRIIVGSSTIHDSMVNSSVGTFTKTVTGTGEQLVRIYINNVLTESYYLQF